MTTITIDRALLEQTLQALENAEDQLAKPYSTDASKAITALRAALAQQAEPVEPVAEARYDGTLRWLEPHGVGLHRIQGPLYTAPPQQAEPVLQGPVRIKPGSYTLGATWVGGGGGSGGVGAPPQQAEPNVEYERGFIDGMQKQAQSSVDRAVNRMAEQAMLGVWQDVPGAVNFGIKE